MRFAFCVEDDTDEEIFRALLEKLWGEPIEVAQTFRFPRGGFGPALTTANAIARRTWFEHLDGALFAIDNDGHEPHRDDHVPSKNSSCRLCRLRFEANLGDLLARDRAPFMPAHYLFVVPVQFIETWLLCLTSHPFAGAPEAVGVTHTERRLLKAALYGVSNPDRETRRKATKPLLSKLDRAELARRSESFRRFASEIEEAKSARMRTLLTHGQ